MTDTTPLVNRRHLLQAAAVGTAGIALSGATSAIGARPVATTLQRDILIDSDWRFFLGDVPQARDPAFDDSAWRMLDLPHDWSIEDRPGAPRTTDPWVPPVALWNPGPHPKDAKTVSPELPIVMASVPPLTPAARSRTLASLLPR